MKKVLLAGLVCLLAMSVPAWATHYGVFVGLNKYSSSYMGSDNWLSGCVPDANHIYTNTIQRGGWTAATVTRLLDSAGTKAAIRLAITNRAATAVSGDTFLYYHSSHGGQESGKSVYLCAYDTDYTDTELAGDLAKFATGVKVVVMVDACHSGGLFQSSLNGTRVLKAALPGSFDLAGSVTKIMDEERAVLLARGTKGMDKLISASEIGWITAANYDQYSWDGDTGGLFTDKVIEGWTNPVASSCDLNSDGYANFYELYDYSWDVANNSEYEYTTAVCTNTSVLQGTIAGWIGSTSPGGLVTFSNLTAQSVTVGQTLVVPVGAYTSGTNLPATVTMTTVQAGASYGSGRLTFTPTADGTYVFNFTATNTAGGSATAALTVNAWLAAPTLAAATGIGNDRFTANWSAVTGAASYALDVATASTFSAGGSGTLTAFTTNLNSGLSAGWEYVNGASNAGTYHKLVVATDPGVVSPAFSTVGYTNAVAGFSVATYGGSTANGLVVSYSLNGGSSWTAAGTNSSAVASSPYVSGSIALPAGALGQASVRVKYHCPGATGSVGLRLQNLAVSGAQPAGASTLVLNGQSVAGTTYTVTGLEMGATYYYRVKAVGNATGPLSTTGSVATAASDSAPSFAAIAGQSATVGALFTLDISGAVSGYPVPALALFSSTAAGADYSFAGGTLSFTPSATGTFAFVFRASNTLGVASATASVAVAAAPLFIPTASIANLSSNSFTVNWTATTGGSTYQVQVATDNVFAADSGLNLMSNPGFETGDSTDWDKFETEYAVVGTDPQEGSYHVACTATGTRDLMQTVDLTGDGVTAYEISFYYKKPLSNGNARIWASWATGGQVSGDSLQPTTYLPAAADWTQVTYTVVPASGANSLNFEVRTYSGASVQWDGFFVGVASGAKGTPRAVLVDQTVAALTYGVTGLTPETPYYARVRATGGEWSDVVSATTTGGAVVTPDPEPITGVCSPTNGAGMSMQIASLHGVTYELQYTTNLSAQPPVWVRAVSCAGTGAGVTLQDPDSLGIQRFYRIVKP